MDITILLLKDCVHPHSGNINEWNFVTVHQYDVRLYYQKKYDDGSFLWGDFYAVKRIGEYVTNQLEVNKWNKDTCIVECLLFGIASWDAIRHIYFGSEASDNYGYFYYPNIEELIETLKAINNLFPYTL